VIMQTICNYILDIAWVLLFSAGSVYAETHSIPRLKVLTSVLPIYCFTAKVAGEAADVSNLLPAGEEPHDYQLSPGDLRKIAAADIVIINGLGLEEWMMKAIRPTGATPKPILEVATSLGDKLIRKKGMANPHFWLDPQLAAFAVRAIGDALKKADPNHAALYEANVEVYREKLGRLDAEMELSLAPIRDISLVTYHDSFPYLARRFGFHIVGLVETVPDVSTSPRELAALFRIIRENKVEALLAEKGEHSRLARQICRDAKIRSIELTSLERGIINPNAYEAGMIENTTALSQLRKKP
jgi:zinc transport system substrate-binding protein